MPNKVYNPTDAPVTLASGLVVGARSHADVPSREDVPAPLIVKASSGTKKRSASREQGDDTPKES